MINLSSFSESLKELMLSKEIDSPSLAKRLGIHENSVNRYLAGTSLPTLENALRLASFFESSIEYLLGRTENNIMYAVRRLPPFCEQLRFLFAYFKSNEYQLHRGAKISRSITYAWLNQNATPTLENLAKIADLYDCTIDFVIGRER